MKCAELFHQDNVSRHRTMKMRHYKNHNKTISVRSINIDHFKANDISSTLWKINVKYKYIQIHIFSSKNNKFRNFLCKSLWIFLWYLSMIRIITVVILCLMVLKFYDFNFIKYNCICMGCTIRRKTTM